MQKIGGYISDRTTRREAMKRVYVEQVQEYTDIDESAQVIIFLATAISALPYTVKDRKDLELLFKSAIMHEKPPLMGKLPPRAKD